MLLRLIRRTDGILPYLVAPASLQRLLGRAAVLATRTVCQNARTSASYSGAFTRYVLLCSAPGMMSNLLKGLCAASYIRRAFSGGTTESRSPAMKSTGRTPKPKIADRAEALSSGSECPVRRAYIGRTTAT